MGRFFSWSVNLLRDVNRWTEIVEGFGWDEEVAKRAMMIADDIILNACEMNKDIDLKKELIDIMGDDVEEESIDILVKNIKDSLQYEEEEENLDS